MVVEDALIDLGNGGRSQDRKGQGRQEQGGRETLGTVEAHSKGLDGGCGVRGEVLGEGQRRSYRTRFALGDSGDGQRTTT